MFGAPVFLARGKGGFMTKIKKPPNDCKAGDVGAARLMAFVVVAAIFGHACRGQFGVYGL